MNYTTGKIQELEKLAVIIQRLKSKGKKIVLCHGVFDLLHPGHIRHFNSAKKYGDILVVTITKDKYIKKEIGRPIFSENSRAEILAALAITDYISIIDSASAVECIKAIKPHFYIKGPDYRDKEKDLTGKIYLEEDAVKSIGGELLFTDDATLSSTTLIRKFIPRLLKRTDFVEQKVNKYRNKLMASLQNTKITHGFNNREIDFAQGVKLVIEMILFQTILGKKLLFIGNGGSASIANHLAVDYCNSTQIPAQSCNDLVFLTSISNDYGYEYVFEKFVEIFARERDILVAISSSGKSNNILKGVNKAKNIGCKVISFSGFKKDNRLRKSGDINFYVSANKYGFVEATHLAINHLILDMIVELQRSL